MMDLQLTFLGVPCYIQQGQFIRLNSAKSVGLLAYLAAHPLPQPRERLLTFLWPTSTPEAARKNLSNTLWSLNKLLSADIVYAEGDLLRLDSNIWIDVREFDRITAKSFEYADESSVDAIREASRQMILHYTPAVKLYQGMYLDGVNFREAPEFETWVLTERERFVRLYLQTLTRLVTAYRMEENWAQIVHVAQQALRYDPLHEPAHYALIEAYGYLGQRREALRQYQFLETLLVTEFGVEPDLNTKSLQQSITKGELHSPFVTLPEGKATRKPNVKLINPLPRDIGQRFVGREAEQTQLRTLLSERTRLISVYGRSGIGKTVLVSKVLSDMILADTLPYTGVLSLSALHVDLDLRRLLTELARLCPADTRTSLEAQWQQPQLSAVHRVDILLDQLGETPYLLLLDNANSLQNPVDGTFKDAELMDFISTIVQRGSLHLLLTSREPLALPLDLRPLERVVPLREGLSPEDCVQLLQLHDPDHATGLTEISEEQIQDIIAITRGFPRALEAMIGLFLDDYLVNVHDWETTRDLILDEVVPFVVGQAIDQLDTTSQWVLQALAVYRLPVPPTAVAFLLEPITSDTRTAINRLIRRYFVHFERSSGLLTLHPLDRSHAYGQIPSEQVTQLHQRAAEFYQLQRRENPQHINDLDPYLREFEQWFLGQRIDTAAELLLYVDEHYLTTWGYHRRLITKYEELLTHDVSESLYVRCLMRLGQAYFWIGAAEKALQLFEQALDDAQVQDDKALQAQIHRSLSNTHYRLGGLEQMQHHSEQAIGLYHQLGDVVGEARARSSLGQAYAAQGNGERAISLYLEALPLAEVVNEHNLQISLLHNLGMHYLGIDDNKLGVEYVERALTLSRQVGHRFGEASCLLTLGSNSLEAGHFAYAEQLHTQALDIHRTRGDRFGECIAIGNIGITQLVAGRYAESVEQLQQSMTIAHEVKSTQQISYKGAFLAAGWVLLGDLPRAFAVIREARTVDVPPNNNHVALIEGLICLLNDDPAQARLLLEEAVQFSDDLLEKLDRYYTGYYTRGTAKALLSLLVDYTVDEIVSDFARAHAIRHAPGIASYYNYLLAAVPEDVQTADFVTLRQLVQVH